MKGGVTSYAFPWAIGIPGWPQPAVPMPASFLLRRTAMLGLAVVQLCDNLRIADCTAPQLRELAREAHDLGLVLELGGRGLTRENFRLHLRAARELNASLVRFVIDAPGYEPDLHAIAALLREMLPELEASGITLAIENHDRFPARDLAALVEKVGDARVGVCLDTANSLAAGEGFETVLEALAPHTVCLHLKDVIARRAPHGLGIVIAGCAPGQGLIGAQLPETLARLERHGRCGACLLESWPEPDEEIERTIAREDAWAATGADLLRRLLNL